MRLAILLLLFYYVRGASIFEDMLDEWRSFKVKHNKEYPSETEEIKRLLIFLENAQKIKQHNEVHGDKYQLRINKYADLHHEEFVNLMNGYNKTFGLPIHETNYVPYRRGKLPSHVDWRKEGAVTEVKDQGNCGSCWAFSTTGALEGQRHRVFGKLVSLSEQNLIDCSRRFGNEGCDGGLMDFAYRYIMENRGIATEKTYPYFSQNRLCKYKKEDFGASITGYIDLPSGNETVLKEAVALVGPISVAIDASHLSFQFYQDGIYDEPDCSNVDLDHGVLIVGYGTKGEHDYWIVKNSWGKDWGMNGYILMRRNKNNQCGIATKASYPII